MFSARAWRFGQPHSPKMFQTLCCATFSTEQVSPTPQRAISVDVAGVAVQFGRISTQPAVILLAPKN